MSDKMSPEEVREARRWAYWTDADRSRIFAHIDALERELAAAEARGFERARERAERTISELWEASAFEERPTLVDMLEALRAMRNETP